MTGSKRMTEDQWAEVRARWEGDRRDGFTWLADEIAGLYGIQITRQGLRKASLIHGWRKTDAALAAVAAAARKLSPPMERPTVIKLTAREMQPPKRTMSRAKKSTGTTPGRRVMYRPEFAQQIVAHFRFAPVTYAEVAAGGGATRIELRPNTPPMLVTFAEAIGTTIETLGRWATDTDDHGALRHPEFAEAYKTARDLLEDGLLRGGLMGVYDASTTILTLKNWYGWRDRPADDAPVQAVSRELLETRYLAVMNSNSERMRDLIEERRRLRRERADCDPN